jgi:cyanosortase A-associated protein
MISQINQMQWRSYLLTVTTISLHLALAYSVFVPTAGNRQVAEFKFPQDFNRAVAIAKTFSQNKAGTETETIQARQKYQYSQGSQAINLEISYLVSTRGDVATYLQNYTTINAEAIKEKSIKQLEGVGYHALLSEDNRAYLTSCISPRSPSNVTQKQFSQYRYQNDLQWQIGLDWLQGKASIRDRRCLWVLLSTTVTRGNSQVANLALETAWKEIYQWWLPRFPDLTEN